MNNVTLVVTNTIIEYRLPLLSVAINAKPQTFSLFLKSFEDICFALILNFFVRAKMH